MTKKILTIVSFLTITASAFALDMFPGESSEIYGTEVNCKKVVVDPDLPKCSANFEDTNGCGSATVIRIGEKVYGCATASEAATIILKLQRANQCK